MHQETLPGVDTREREPLTVELPPLCLVDKKPGTSVRTKRLLVKCPVCGLTGEFEKLRTSRVKNRIIHWFHPTGRGGYRPSSWCDAWRNDADKALAAAQKMVDGT